MPRSRRRKNSRTKRRDRPEVWDEIPESRRNVAEDMLTLVEPYRHEVQSPEELERLLLFGTLAWNLSLLPPSERASEIRRMARELFPKPRFRLLRLLWQIVPWPGSVNRDPERLGDLLLDMEFEKAMVELIERKQRLFPDG